MQTTSNMATDDLKVVSNIIITVAKSYSTLYFICSEVNTNLNTWNKEKQSCIVMDYSYNGQYLDVYGSSNNYPYYYTNFQNKFQKSNGGKINILVWQL